MKFSSKNKSVLIFSDFHTDFRRAQKIIDKESPDIILDLGDHFDSHSEQGIGIKENREMALWLKMMLKKDNFFSLSGNHDNSYRYINRFCRCSGYSEVKDTEINDVMMDSWDKLHNFFQLDEFLLTHAGLSGRYVPDSVKNVDDAYDYLVQEEAKAKEMMRNGAAHWFYNVGECRGGRSDVGGIFWLDFTREFEPNVNFKEIFGHSFSPKVRELEGNYCIDTQLSQYLTITNEKLEIKSFIDL